MSKAGHYAHAASGKEGRHTRREQIKTDYSANTHTHIDQSTKAKPTDLTDDKVVNIEELSEATHRKVRLNRAVLPLYARALPNEKEKQNKLSIWLDFQPIRRINRGVTEA